MTDSAQGLAPADVPDDSGAGSVEPFRATVTKPGIDLGIVMRNPTEMLAFYRDVLGLDHFLSQPMPLGLGGTMHRVRCGDSVLKLVDLAVKPEKHDATGGLNGATGLRYLTFFVTDMDEILARAAAAGHAIPIKRTTARPGVDIAMIADPDGNWVEIGQTYEA